MGKLVGAIGVELTKRDGPAHGDHLHEGGPDARAPAAGRDGPDGPGGNPEGVDGVQVVLPTARYGAEQRGPAVTGKQRGQVLRQQALLG